MMTKPGDRIPAYRGETIVGYWVCTEAGLSYGHQGKWEWRGA